MSGVAGSRPPRQTDSFPWLITFGAALAALVVSAAVALAATPVYKFFSTLLGVSEGVWTGVLFSSFLLLLGVAVAVCDRAKSDCRLDLR